MSGLLSENETALKELFDVKSRNKENAIKDFSLNTSIPKPFLLLAGISGTGKTRFVRKQAEARGQLSSTYCLTSVRPDWHEPSDLLGYVSRLGGHAEYITTDVLTFMAQAWRAIVDNENLNIECVDSDGQGKRLVVSGEAEALEDVPPYWLCLDEMNLAPVEQYFADYLSVLETREWCWDGGDSFHYSCDALLKPSFIQLNGAEQAYNTKLRESLKLADSKYDDLWHCFCEYGLPIPFNLIVAGTVNMDETTHGFSRKVIDRAMSFDFGEFFPNEIDEFFEGDKKKSVNTLSYPILSHVRNIEEFSAVEADSDANKTKAFFKAINNVLKNTPFELAFRAFNELCLSVICFAPKTDTELAAVFDDYLMCKVLPRIEGDEDKVRTSQGHNLLEQLTEVLQEQLTAILPNHESISRPDLLRHFEGETEEKVVVEWRSEKKLKAMTAQLNNGFCSFWP
ncbi:5-methylcytosine-specific restriction related enzyme [Vibrio sp. RC586]|nr:5-methylcytosine-specific restriction related enzyme [Vibrio sp. RC586]